MFPGKKKKSPVKDKGTIDLTLIVSKVVAKVAVVTTVDKKDGKDADASAPTSKDKADLDDELLTYDKNSQKMRSEMKEKLGDGKTKSPKKQTKKNKTKKKEKPTSDERAWDSPTTRNESSRKMAGGRKLRGVV